MNVDVTVSCPVHESFRVQQVAGMFDVPLAARATQQFRVEIPEWREPWKIGLIVGPSGSGKTTIAREMFGTRLAGRREWPDDRAVVDGLGELPIKTVTGLFTAVGFSSPPAWVRPYSVLSNGERFRCDLARALAEADASEGGPGDLRAGDVVAFDEFTSVVDRNVARAVSASVAKGIRAGRIGCRLVAVTCHYDVADWLQPDWVIDMATGSFQRRCLSRPPIRLEIFRCGRGAWRLFARHHYLSGSLSTAARCYLALWEGEPVTFCATVSLIARKGRYRVTRLVTLPDYQGLGLGMAVLEAVAQLHCDEGHRLNLTASHPAVVSHCRRSPRWRAVGVRKTGSGRMSAQFVRGYRSSAGRAVVSFEYLASAADS
jgi:GNAT superfamily N-acetyltransferase